MSLQVHELISGAFYRVVFNSPVDDTPRQMVAKYHLEESGKRPTDTWIIDSQIVITIPTRLIQSIEPVPYDTPTGMQSVGVVELTGPRWELMVLGEREKLMADSDTDSLPGMLTKLFHWAAEGQYVSLTYNTEPERTS